MSYPPEVKYLRAPQPSRPRQTTANRDLHVRNGWCSVYAVVMMGLFTSSVAAETMLGDPAPEFTLLDQHKAAHTLADYKGKWVVLYFYPKDDTPGCTKEACRFRDDIFVLRALDAQVLGVSIDSVDSHAKFAEKYSLPFPLLADTGGDVAKSYGALWALGPVKFAKRHSFIIDPQGNIAKVYRSVKPEQHSDEIIRDLRTLQGS